MLNYGGYAFYGFLIRAFVAEILSARRRPLSPAVDLTRPNLINMSILNPEFTYPNLPGTPHFLGTPKGSRLQNLG